RMPSAAGRDPAGALSQGRRAVGCRRLGHRGLVEIPRVVVVAGGPEETAKVPDGGIAVLGGLGDRARLGEDGGREVGLEPALAHRPPGDLPELAPMGARRRTHARRAPGIARRPTSPMRRSRLTSAAGRSDQDRVPLAENVLTTVVVISGMTSSVTASKGAA